MTVKRFEELKDQIKSYDSWEKDAENKVEACEAVVNSKKECMRMGNVCLVLGAIAVAVMLVLYFVKKESVYLYYAAECGFILLIGVIRKIYGKIKYAKLSAPYGGKVRIRGRLIKLKEELEAFKSNNKAESAFKEIKEASRYTGMDWDISKFVVTPENIAALEIDAEKFFLAVCCADYINKNSSYSADIKGLICDSWFGAFCFKKEKTFYEAWDPKTLKFFNQEKKEELGKLNNILEQMEQSGSWRIAMTAKMLRFGGIHIGSKFLEMKNTGTVSKPKINYGDADLKRLFEFYEIQYTEPNNESDREFFSICDSSAREIAYYLQYKVYDENY